MTRMMKLFLWLCPIALLIGGCASQPTVIANLSSAQTKLPTTPTVVQPLSTNTPEPTKPAITINPLTGLRVEDSSLLSLPAALVSISHFPPAARPQAGLSFAPFVFEVYITEGATRFLTTFYGEFPKPEPRIIGNCAIRTEPFKQTDLILGNRVWWDANQNNLEDPWERGIGGVCVNLYDANNNLLQQTTTDSNGYYAFNISAGKYFIEVVKPKNMEFDQKNFGGESQASVVDQATGRSDAVDVTSSLLNIDAGLILLKEPSSSSDDLPAPLVGPVRSGRLVYGHIASFFPGSCLIFAYASAEVLVELPKCAFVDHIIQGGGYMLEIARLKQLVTDRKNTKTPEYYTSNTFSADVPEGGVPATRLDVYFAWLNQSAWVYDAASQTWWRYVDTADPDTAGILHPEVDRLNNRQLQFENVIVLFAKHDVVSPTNLNIHVDPGLSGDALLFRDGQMYKIHWSTKATDANNENHKPIEFYYPDGKTLFPLKPGHTWITLVTPQTSVTEQSAGKWLLQFSQPPGAK
jgi:SdrD B-like protein/DUF3048 family protein